MTSALASPAPFGDGVLCLGGTLRRLGAKSNTAGAAQFPGPGDLPISVRGLVTSPGAQFYQVYYRDLGAFCPPATFNITRGVRIYWQL